MKYVHDPIGSTDFKYWEASVLADFSEEDIKRGAKRAEDWKGFMGLGDFRGLCRKERNHLSHSQFKALPHKAMEGNEIQLDYENEKGARIMSGGINKVIIIGNVGNDPEVKRIDNGNAVANFSIATSETWKDKDSGQKQEKTEWHRIVVWGRLAEIIEQYVKKGLKTLFGRQATD